MTHKETILANIMSKIKALQDAYEKIKQLPNDVFDMADTTSNVCPDGWIVKNLLIMYLFICFFATFTAIKRERVLLPFLIKL